MCGAVFTDDELDQMFKNVAMGGPDSDDNKPSSPVRLFTAVGSLTAEWLDRAKLALAEGSNGKRQPKGGSCQGPPLISIPKCEIL